MPTKEEIRKIHLDKRASFSENYIKDATKEININLIKTLNNYKRNDTIIGLYAAIRNEINLDDTIANLTHTKTLMALPWIEYHKKTMEFKLWKKDDALFKSGGLYCPQPTESSETISPSIIIAPLVTCDKAGNRIGYGKGYYDKYISQNYKNAPLVIGVCYDKNICTVTIPHEPHDRKLDIIISENNTIILNKMTTSF